ncbi:TIGR03943 family putative permease subunit [Paenibacillus agri]|uniref:TIGR03943 family protein n=1 Tax=Paenibacillus agri TaxID=2744309 RepID=A0A850EKE3_9BACL|nr:TIGR03943 family protein [Paenibacillus agri]NUU59844.1 TIGR03943 family protein [Paenibacillus agri]
MNESRSIRLHYLLRAVLLLAFALYIGHLAQQDALHYYVAPKLARWIKLCPIPLTLMALSLTVQALFGKGAALCDCDHRLPRWGIRSTVLYGLFLLPLLFGFLLPDRPLGSLAASVKGIELTYNIKEPDREVQFNTNDPFEVEFAQLAKLLYSQPVIPVYPDIFSETFGAIERYKQKFEGKDIAVSGFVYRENATTTNGPFALSRFLVQCCTADATPFGIMVYPGTPKSLPADTWVEVRGKLHVGKYKGKDIVQISAVSITPIPRPATPYIYTSPDSVAEWAKLQASGKSIR